ncbi:monosaccharide-transporting ATPase [Bacteroidia bacterium]|nr:monosaccharide-transporting ATPase [Bacteroidia bacterium]
MRKSGIAVNKQLLLGDIAVKYGVYFALLVLILMNLFLTPNFMNINVLWNVMIQSATILLISLGMTIVISGGGIDLSVGSTMSLCSVIMAYSLERTNSIFLSFVFSLLVSVLCGLLVGGVIAVFKIQAMIVTLAFMTLFRGVAMLFPSAGIIRITNMDFLDFSLVRLGGIFPMQVIIILGTVVIVSVLMRRMSFGRYVEAIGDNESGARYAGVKIVSITILMYIFCAILAGMSGILETSRIAASNGMNVGKMVEMDAVASTVIGGTPLTGGRANIVGTMMGVFIMQIITIMVNMNNIPYEYSMIIKAIIILISVYIQKTNGMFRRAKT